MNMEKQPRRLNKISGAFATALLIAACESNAPVATPTPVRTPEATPSPIPTLVATPTPEVTPSPVITPTPTLEVTPTPTVEPTPTIEPTPEVTPTPIDALVDQIIADAKENGWKNITAEDVTNSINEAYENDPDAAAVIVPDGQGGEVAWRENINYLLNDCLSSEGALKSQTCAVLFGATYWGGLRIDMNDVWNSPLSNIVHYANGELNSQDFNTFKNTASQEKPYPHLPTP
jgi:hypothetical protein